MMTKVDLSCYALLHFESTTEETSLFHDDYLSELATAALNTSNKMLYTVMLRDDKIDVAKSSLRTRIGSINDNPEESENRESETARLWGDVVALQKAYLHSKRKQ